MKYNRNGSYTKNLTDSLLMNLAVSDGAEEGKNFVYYINYLEEKGFITKKSKDWVDHIRKMGNLATHEIRVVEKEEAEKLITFCEMLLKSDFEYPALAGS